MLYTISKLSKSRIQSFKPCMIWSSNEEDMAWGRYGLRKTTAPSLCEFRTTPSACAKFAPTHASLVRILLCFADSTWDLFLCIFYVNSFLIPVISQSQALLCKDYKRGGNHLTNICYVLHLVKYRALVAFLFSLLFSFSWKPNNLWGCFPRGWEAKLLVSWSEGS